MEVCPKSFKTNSDISAAKTIGQGKAPRRNATYSELAVIIALPTAPRMSARAESALCADPDTERFEGLFADNPIIYLQFIAGYNGREVYQLDTDMSRAY